MNEEFSHDEFCEKLKNDEIICGVNNFWISLIYISKFLASIVFFLIFILFFVSTLPIFYFSYYESNWFLISLLPVFLACISGKSNLSLIDIGLWFLIFIISAICSLIFWNDSYRIGLLPMICFIISSVITGVTLVEVENRLTNSSETYRLLVDKKQLFIYENYKISKNT